MSYAISIRFELLEKLSVDKRRFIKYYYLPFIRRRRLNAQEQGLISKYYVKLWRAIFLLACSFLIILLISNWLF